MQLGERDVAEPAAVRLAVHAREVDRHLRRDVVEDVRPEPPAPAVEVVHDGDRGLGLARPGHVVRDDDAVVDDARRGDAVVPHQLVERRDVDERRRLVLHRVQRVVGPAVRRVVLDVHARDLGDAAAEQGVPVGLPVGAVLRDDEVEVQVGDVVGVAPPPRCRATGSSASGRRSPRRPRCRTGRYQVTGTCDR